MFGDLTSLSADEKALIDESASPPAGGGARLNMPEFMLRHEMKDDWLLHRVEHGFNYRAVFGLSGVLSMIGSLSYFPHLDFAEA